MIAISENTYREKLTFLSLSKQGNSNTTPNRKAPITIKPYSNIFVIFIAVFILETFSRKSEAFSSVISAS